MLENLLPARAGLVGNIGEDIDVGERQGASGAICRDIDVHATDVFRVPWNAQRERDSARSFELDIRSQVLDVFTVAAFGEVERSADARVDVHDDHLAGL